MHAFTFNVNVGSYPKKLVASSYLLMCRCVLEVCTCPCVRVYAVVHGGVFL